MRRKQGFEASAASNARAQAGGAPRESLLGIAPQQEMRRRLAHSPSLSLSCMGTSSSIIIVCDHL